MLRYGVWRSTAAMLLSAHPSPIVTLIRRQRRQQIPQHAFVRLNMNIVVKMKRGGGERERKTGEVHRGEGEQLDVGASGV